MLEVETKDGIKINGVVYVPLSEKPIGSNLEDALSIVFSSDAGANITLRQYFEKLLLTLWDEEDGFSGKRPFGNSSWQHDIFRALVINGFIDGTIEKNNEENPDYWDIDYSTNEANRYTRNIILFLMQEKK